MRTTETSHFWLGNFPKDLAAEYLAEVWDLEDEDRVYTPLSAFARDQGERWYDHDFLESGWGKASSIAELVAGYSYSDQWAGELARRAAAAGLADVNFLVFISQDQITHPRSVRGERFWLHYLGTIKYRI